MKKMERTRTLLNQWIQMMMKRKKIMRKKKMMKKMAVTMRTKCMMPKKILPKILIAHYIIWSNVMVVVLKSISSLDFKTWLKVMLRQNLRDVLRLSIQNRTLVMARLSYSGSNMTLVVPNIFMSKFNNQSHLQED